MALRQIRQYGDEILTKKAKPVRVFDDALHRLLEDMWDTLRENDGLGLAAPQIGMLRQVIVIELEEETYELINPVMVGSSGSEVKAEACLSVPERQGDVERPTYVKIEAMDRYGVSYVVEGEDMLATALCHELDHLDGVLFLDKATNIQKRLVEETMDEEDPEIKKSGQDKDNNKKGKKAINTASKAVKRQVTDKSLSNI